MLHELLTARRRFNGAIGRTIGEEFKRICNTGQLECEFVGCARSLQHNDAFSAEVNSQPKHQSKEHAHAKHEYIVAGDGDRFSSKSNYVVREQWLLHRRVFLLTASNKRHIRHAGNESGVIPLN